MWFQSRTLPDIFTIFIFKFFYLFYIPTTISLQMNESSGYKLKKGEAKAPLLADDTIVHILI